jgi:hypothetical protein
MSVYVHGRSRAAQQAQQLEFMARNKVAKLAALNAELDARIKAQEELLKHVPPTRTYKPSAEQIAYRDQYLAKYGPDRFGDRPDDGPRRLRLAVAEMFKES